jgi:putative tryptophan/tyrosine transport system substrate-binding protein
MRRRKFIALLGGAAAWPLAVRAQQPGKLPRIGYLSPSSAVSGFLGRDNAFREGLSELGYVEGKSIIIEYRFADGQFDRLAALAAELVALNVDIIVAVVTQASVVAKEATPTIPIIMVAVSDPLGSRLVPSLARPGGNVTGTASQTTEMVGKSLQLLKEVVPKAARVAVLWNPDNAVFQAQMLKETRRAGAALGLRSSIAASRRSPNRARMRWWF